MIGAPACFTAIAEPYWSLAARVLRLRSKSLKANATQSASTRNNVSASVELFSVAYSAGVNRIIFSSSAAVYGAPDRLPVPCTLEAHSGYGLPKRMVEEILTDLSRANAASYVMLRYFNAGADPDGELGEGHDPEGRLIPNAIAVASGRTDLIFGNDYPTPDGTWVRDYLHVSDIANAHVAALQSLLVSQPRSMILNAGMGRGHSIREVIGEVGRVIGQPVPHIVAPRRPGDVLILVADPRQSRTQLGFNAVRSELKVIVEDAWRFLRQKWGISNVSNGVQHVVASPTLPIKTSSVSGSNRWQTYRERGGYGT